VRCGQSVQIYRVTVLRQLLLLVSCFDGAKFHILGDISDGVDFDYGNFFCSRKLKKAGRSAMLRLCWAAGFIRRALSMPADIRKA
ncbi:MAG: hypothetical protein RRY69_05135, partial [Oscillospiraceae bacterium]